MTEDLIQYKLLYNSSPLAHYSVDLDGTILEVNDTWCKLLGYTREEVIGNKKACDIVVPEYKEALKERIETFRSSGSSVESEIEWYTKNGDRILTLVDGKLIYNEDGKFVYSHCVLKNISKQKSAEERFANIIRANPMGVHTYKLEANGNLIFTGSNPSADIILQVDNTKYIGKTIEEAFPNLVDTEIPDKYRELCEFGGSTYQIKDISYEDARVKGVFEVFAFQTSPGYMAALFRDITEDRKVRVALEESEEKFRNISEQSPNIIYILKGSKVVYVNEMGLSILGYTREDYYEKPFDVTTILAPEDQERASKNLNRRLEGEDLPPVEYTFITRGGKRKHIIISTRFIKYEGELAILGTGVDITEQRRAEDSLKESEERIKRFYDASFEGIAVTIDGKIVDVNQRFCDLYGYAQGEPIGKDVTMFVAEEDRDMVFHRMLSAYDQPYEHKGVHKDGSILYLEVRGLSIKIDGIDARITAIHDITERKRDEERFMSLLALMELNVDKEDEIIDKALEESVRLTNSKIGYLHFVEPNHNLEDNDIKLELFKWSKAVHVGCHAEKMRHYPLAEAGVWADCVRQRKPVIHNDYPNNPTNKGLPEGHFPVHRHMSVPIFEGNKIVAIAGVGNKEKFYDDSDVRQLSLFMNSMWDIMKRFRVEAELRKEKERLQTYLDVATSIFIVLDRNGHIQMINKRGCDILGCAVEEDVLGKNWLTEFVPEDERDRVINEFRSLMDGAKDWSVIENAIVNLYDERRIIKWRNTVLRDDNAVIAFTLSSGEDLTEQRALEAKQEEYWVKAEQMLTDNVTKIKRSFRISSKISNGASAALDDALKKLIEHGEG